MRFNYIPSRETRKRTLLTQLSVLFAFILVACFLPVAGLGAAGLLGAGMIIDAHQRFSNAQAIASAASTNVIDFGVERRIGSGKPMAIVIVVTTLLIADDGDETYTATVQSDDDEAFGTAATVVAATSLPRGSAAGTMFVIPIPPRKITERYMRLLYAVGGTTPTGAVTAWLTSMEAIQTDAHYADAITISI